MADRTATAAGPIVVLTPRRLRLATFLRLLVARLRLAALLLPIVAPKRVAALHWLTRVHPLPIVRPLLWPLIRKRMIEARPPVHALLRALVARPSAAVLVDRVVDAASVADDFHYRFSRDFIRHLACDFSRRIMRIIFRDAL